MEEGPFCSPLCLPQTQKEHEGSSPGAGVGQGRAACSACSRARPPHRGPHSTGCLDPLALSFSISMPGPSLPPLLLSICVSLSTVPLSPFVSDSDSISAPVYPASLSSHPPNLVSPSPLSRPSAISGPAQEAVQLDLLPAGVQSKGWVGEGQMECHPSTGT